ncbi:MAG: HAMP domain-containing histidine kinase [Acidimicrobiia bacterium]|nr:HAMP domain-containing histidine kinase [Acidimicrobiia bacterium]
MRVNFNTPRVRKRNALPAVARRSRNITVVVAMGFLLVVAVAALPADLAEEIAANPPEASLNWMSLGALLASLGMLRSRYSVLPDPLAVRLAALLSLLGLYIAAATVAQALTDPSDAEFIMQVSRISMIPCGLWLAYGRSQRLGEFGEYTLAAGGAFAAGLAVSVWVDRFAQPQFEIVAVVGLAAAGLAVLIEGIRNREPRLQLAMLVLACAAALEPGSWLVTDALGGGVSQQLFVFAFVGAVMAGVVFDLRDVTVAAQKIGEEAAFQRNQAERLLEHQYNESERLIHDSRNALLAVHGGLRALSVSEKDRSLVASIDAELDRVQAMIEATRNPKARFLIRDAVSSLVEVYQSAGFDIVSRIPEGCAADGDPMIVGEIVQNLIENSIRHGGPGQIEVTVRQTEESIILSVADRGPGIELADPNVLFLPGVSDGKGHGVGLSISRRLASSLGGSLTASNRVGGGAVFQLTLRRHEDDIIDLREAPKPEKAGLS